MFKHTLVAGALAVGVTTIGATGAHAGGPDETFRIDERFETADEFLTELCGFPVTFALDTHGWVRLWDDRVHVTERGSVVLTNEDNGRTLTSEWAGAYRGRGTETFDEDGTLTVRFVDTNVGIPERWRDHDGKVLIFDRGRAVFDGELVIDLGDPEDPDDDVLVSEDVDVTTNGPHPILEQGFLDPSLACELLA